MKLTLFIDTSLFGASLALCSLSGENPFWSDFYEQKGAADSAISKMLDEGLKRTNATIQDIHSVVVSHGPGSFTGIKVGLAWAYGFQAGHNSKMLGLSSLACGLEALSQNLSLANLAILIPISRREAFLCWREMNEIKFDSLTLGSLSAANTLDKLVQQGCSFALIGPGEPTIAWFNSMKIDAHTILITEFMRLAMQGMIRRAKGLGLSAFQDRPVEPYYFKRSSVEEKFDLLKDPSNGS